MKSFTWSGQAESRLIWDGRGNDKSILPDGTYVYRLASLDEAGNRGVSPDLPFRLDTAETPVFVSAEYSSFSPNGDGTKDTIKLLPQVKVPRGIEKYELKISAEDGSVVKSFGGSGSGVPAFTWDGKDSRGQKASDGRYSAQLTVNYENGNVPIAKTQAFVLDTVAPEIQLSIDRTLFSPNDDGRKDSITINQTSSDEEVWSGKIETVNGEPVRTYSWKNRAPGFTWDGKDEYGNRVKDGSYRYTVSAVDSAGNGTVRKLEGITVDTRPTSVFVTANRTGFSPNGDGTLDDITFSTIVNLREGIESWNLSLLDQSGAVQKKFGGKDLPPSSIRWDGKSDSGAVKEGTYTAKFTVVYGKGDEPSAAAREFSLDISAPQASVSLDPSPFSPDNDGVADEVSIGLSVRDKNAIESWKFEIRDPAGHAFISFDGKGAPTSRIWDGRSSTAEYVQAAEDYPYILTVRDSLGNTGRVEGLIPVDVLVVREGDRLKIRVSSINFPAYKSNIVWENEEASAKNLKILKRLAEILNKYSSYHIRIEGHAVSEYWNLPARAEKEEIEELQPLSLARAEAVKQKLAELGVDATRVSTLGRGGKEPVVPHGDLENRWKNRRVEFILLK